MSYCGKLVVLGLLLAGCKSSTEPPDPSVFGPIADRRQADPRAIVFHNESVEMAELEVFAPRTALNNCQSEAPHRMLCPADYRHILNKPVYPRTKIKVGYPKELPLGCAQVWIRVHSKAMGPTDFREAIFLLVEQESGLDLELGEGQAARLEQRESGSRNTFPAPVRYCPAAQGGQSKPPDDVRDPSEVKQVVDGASDRLAACCKSAPCRGQLKLALTLRRDGTVLQHEVVETRGQAPTACLVQALGESRFGGFTTKLTRAEVSLRLPLAR